jgi:hypothetical protein
MAMYGEGGVSRLSVRMENVTEILFQVASRTDPRLVLLT